MGDGDTIPEVTDRKEYVNVKTTENIMFGFFERQGCPVSTGAEQGFGLNWDMSFQNERNTPNRYDLVIKCNQTSLSNVWELSCFMELVVRGCTSREVMKVEKKFNSNDNSMTIPGFLELDLSELALKYLHVELKITMKELVGRPKSYEFDFENEYEVISDATLVAFDEEKNRDRKLYVSKSYLSLYSPVFREMFSRLEHEKKPAEIKMDASYEWVVILLDLIYPSHSLPGGWNWKFYLEPGEFEIMFEIAEKYKIDYVKRRLEEFLISEPSVCFFWRFQFAEKYELDLLMNKCLLEIKSVNDAKRAVEEEGEEYVLSNRTKSAIFDRLMSLPHTEAELNSSDSEDD